MHTRRYLHNCCFVVAVRSVLVGLSLDYILWITCIYAILKIRVGFSFVSCALMSDYCHITADKCAAYTASKVAMVRRLRFSQMRRNWAAWRNSNGFVT